MLPSQKRLLLGINDGLRALSKTELNADAEGVLGNVKLALQELILRQDNEFFREHIKQGQELWSEGQQLAASLSQQPQTSDGQLNSTAAERDPLILVDGLADALALIVEALASAEDDEPKIKAFLSRVVDWENELYKARHRPLPPEPPAASIADLSEASIKSYFEQRFPERAPITVQGVKKLVGGFSKSTALIDLAYADGAHESLVIRAEQPNELIFLDGAHIANEYHVLKYAFSAGHAVAEPLWLETDTRHMGQRFLVSRKARGATFGSRVDVDQQLNENLLGDFMEKLVRIHNTPIDRTNEDIQKSHLAKWARFSTLRDLIPEQVRVWRAGSIGFGVPPSPILSRALTWLERHTPDSDDAPSLLHGDYGLHNIMIDGDKISCVLDWEASGLGDPADDLAWILDGLRAKIDPSRLLALYEEIAGRRIPPERLSYFEVFNCLRFAVTCPRALILFEGNPSLDVASCNLGLRFTYFGTGRLNETIARAEALRGTA